MKHKDYYFPMKAEMNDKLFITYEMMLEVKTKLKLNVIGRNGDSLLKDTGSELHYLHLESVVGDFKLNDLG